MARGLSRDIKYKTSYGRRNRNAYKTSKRNTSYRNSEISKRKRSRKGVKSS